MSAYLHGFTAILVDRLLAEEQLEITPGTRDRVIASVSAHLTRSRNTSLISTFVAGLMACDDVLDLFADDDTIKAYIEALPPRGW